jgi:hypothetical protein
MGVSRSTQPKRQLCKSGIRSDIIIPLVHAYHLVFASTVSPSASTSPSRLTTFLLCSRLRSRRRLAAKIDWPQFAPLACPHAKRSHDGRATYLKRPPEQVGRYRVRIQGGDDQVDEVDSQGEIEDELRAGDKEQYKYGTVAC